MTGLRTQRLHGAKKLTKAGVTKVGDASQWNIDCKLRNYVTKLNKTKQRKKNRK